MDRLICEPSAVIVSSAMTVKNDENFKDRTNLVRNVQEMIWFCDPEKTRCDYGSLAFLQGIP